MSAKDDAITAITPHFKKRELSCPCCGKFNMPRRMLDFVERVRNGYGRPMHINSAVRCKRENDRVGGEPDSAHLSGLAIDVSCTDSRSRRQLLKAAEEAGVLGIGIYPTFLHLDLKSRIWDTCWIGGAPTPSTPADETSA